MRERLVPYRRGRRGFFIVDVIIALGLLVALAAILALAMSRHARAQRKLAATREAGRVVEEVLLTLQAGRIPAASADVDLRRISAVEDGSGDVWVEVSVLREGASARLVGRVRGEDARQGGVHP